LRHVSIFADGFSLAAASAVMGSAEVRASDVIDSLAKLAAKSLVATDVAGATVRYRLLETTRAYAREKVAEFGELEQASCIS
jgi:predicted ATPase